MANDLIYDIGMHNGNDTAFYLACGFRVVAVEADPDLAAAGAKRFKAEIESGKLIILNVAIAPQAGKAEFWINELHSYLNSFSRPLAVRSGEPHHSIWVQCRRLDEILSEYGTPYYMKIDIEGHDIVCCEQLSPGDKPKYISVEMSKVELLLRLRDLGYDRFKLIRQQDLQPIGSQDIQFHVHVLRYIFRLANYRKENRKLPMRVGRASAAKVLQLAKALGFWDISLGDISKPFKSRRLPEWNFNEGSASTCSGTFGEDLPGEWLAWEEIAYLWHRDLRAYQKLGQALWCDLHATCGT